MALDQKNNPPFTMFLLKCNYGYIERHQKEALDLKRKELEMREKELANRIATGENNLRIEVMQIPNSPLVPEKEDD